MIKNLVIGSEGFVGNPLCAYLDKQGESTYRFDIKRSPKEDARTSKINLEDIDRAYLLAWDVGGSKYLYKQNSQIPQLNWNLKLMENTMPQLAKKNIPFLFVSSQLAEETDTVYGATKRLGEVWTNLYPNGHCVRLWNVYGEIEKTSERSHVISDFIEQAITKRRIEMRTTGEEMRQFIHIDDVCSAFHRVISNNFIGSYDVTSFEWIKIKEVAEMIAGMTGAKVIYGKEKGFTPLTPIKGKIPGWMPRVSLREGIEKMVKQRMMTFQNKESLHLS